MLQLLTELLGYARKLLPLMEIYAARRASSPVRDTATQEFQNYAAEVLRANRADLMELRSVAEGVHQRLRVVEEQAGGLERELRRIAEQQRLIVIAVVVTAGASIGALITGIVVLARH